MEQSSGQLGRIIGEFLQAQQRGEEVNFADLIASHPQWTDELRAFQEAHRGGLDPVVDATVNVSAESDAADGDATLPPSHSTDVEATMAGRSLEDTGVLSAGSANVISGERFGDYLLQDEIARGGIGVVYKARQVALNRDVAIKMILAGHLASSDDVARFYTEAEAAAKLQHPNIVGIYEVGELEGQHFFSMEFVAGDNLSSAIEENPMPPRQAALYTLVLAKAIEYAHQQGILHRDLKPSNVLLQSQQFETAGGGTISSRTTVVRDVMMYGAPKISDFGLAKKLDEGKQSDLTASGAVLGTPSYMPAEQAAGRTKDLGPHSDVYSLGAILYELLTGRPPFQASTPVETIMLVLEQEPVAPSLLNPNVNRDLETICLKCLEKDPGQRYSTAQELADDLERHLDGRAILARPISPTTRLLRWCARNQAIAGLAAALLILLLVLGVGGLIVAGRERSLRGASERARRESQNRLVRRLVKDGLQRVQQYDLAGALPSFLEAYKLDEPTAGSGPTHRLRLAATLRCAPRPERVNFHAQPVRVVRFGLTCEGQHVHLWDPATGRKLAEPLRHEATVTAAVTAVGDRVITGTEKGSVHVWCEGVKLRSWLLSGPIRALATHGTWLAVGDSQQIQVFHLDKGDPVKTWSVQFPVNHLVFGPRGRHLAGALGKPQLGALGMGEARIWSVGQWELSARLEHKGNVTFCCFDDSGKHLATTSDDQLARVWQVQEGALRFPALRHGDLVAHAAFTADGQVLVTACDDDLVRIWDARTGEPLVPPLKHLGEVRKIAISPSGRYLATACFAGTAHIWDLLTGQPVIQGLVHDGPVVHVEFDSNGERLLTASRDKSVRVWRIGGNVLDTRPLRHDRRVRDAAFSPHGRLVATCSFDGTARVWDTQSGIQLTKVQHANRVQHVVFTPSGELFATASRDGTARVWQARTGIPKSPVLQHGKPVNSVQFDPQGNVLLTSCDDGQVRQWDWRTGKLIQNPGVHAAPVGFASFSADGRRIVSRAGKVVRVWTRGEPGSIEIKHDWLVFAADISRDGSRVATACGQPLGEGGGQARIWDTETGKPITGPLKHSHGCEHIEFDPSGKRVVTASFDNTARVWNAVTGAPLTSPMRHAADIYRAVFARHGLWVITCSADNTARVWDAATGEAITPPMVHASWAMRVAVNEPGTQMVIVTMDAQAYLYDLPSEEMTGQPLEQLIQLTSGNRMTPQGLERLATVDFDNLWQSRGEKVRQRLKNDGRRSATWHALERRLASRNGQWQGIHFHCSKLLGLVNRSDKRERFELLLRRANALGEMERFTEAAAGYAAARELNSGYARHAVRQGLALFRAGDTVGLQRLCQELTDPAKLRKRDLQYRNEIARLLVLIPDAVSAARLQALKWDSIDGEVQAAVLYRSGDFAGAIRRL